MEYMESKMQDRLEASMSEYEQMEEEIQTLRAKVEVLVEAVQFYANQDNYYFENAREYIFPSVVKAQKALATYDKQSVDDILEKSLAHVKTQLDNYMKLSEVKHDTK